MQVHVINVDRDADRWERFMRLNGDVIDVVRVPTSDGVGAVDRADLVESGIIADTCRRSNRAISRWGAHIALWSRAVGSGETVTIVDDDAVLAGNFRSAAQQVIDGLASGWDIVMWGWSFDEALWTEIPDGVSVCRIEANNEEMRKHIDGFPSSCGSPTALRLRHCFGSFAYTVTPAGAQVLLDACLPLTDEPITFSCGGVVVDDPARDADVNKALPAMDAHVCVPPLALKDHRMGLSPF